LSAMRNLSNLRAVVNLLKSNVGLALLSLPYATKRTGLLSSLLGMAAVGAITVYGIMFAFAAAAKSEKRRAPTEVTPLKVGAGQLGCGLGCFDAVVQETLGASGLALWASSVLCYQAGIGVAYVTLVSESMTESLGMGRAHALGVLCVTLTVLSSVRRLRGIAVLSLAGLLVYLCVFLALVRESVFRQRHAMLPTSTPLWGPLDSEGLSAWFGIVSFAFCGLPIALSVHEEMERPQDIVKVACCSNACTWLVFALFATFGYLCYGDETADVIYRNFPAGSYERSGAQAAISVILLLSYSMQLMPVWNCIEARLGDSPHWLVQRTATVILTCVIAAVVPSTLVLIAVTGALAAALSGFVLPALVYMLSEPCPSACDCIAAACLLAAGAIGAAKTIV